MIASLRFTPSLERYGERLREKPAALDAAIETKINSLAARLLARIQVKLSGEVLHQRTGVLLRSVEMQAAAWAGSVCGSTVGIPDGSPSWTYAIVHEMGGLGYYDIVPVNAKVLAFAGAGGAMVFASVVHHPPALKRSFEASSVEEIRPIFVAEITELFDSFLGGEGAAA
jgi:hypothetical protein